MPIPRLHLFELEDQPWFPAVVRDLATDYLHFMEEKFALHRPAVALLADAMNQTRTSHIVDLCSGGGGSIASLLDELAAHGLIAHATLTDRYPNLPAFARIAQTGRIDSVCESVDARAVPERLTGFRTLFNAFHHFAPADAIAVLTDAARASQPIGVFEISDRRVGRLLTMLLLTPLMVAVATLSIRPFTWQRLLFTYILPLVPLTCWWDGVVSQLRAYTPAELEQLAASTAANHYTWQAGRTPIGTSPGDMTYLLGYPNPAGSDHTV